LLGGAVGANASLAGRSASLILNEVTGGGGASLLNGILEVFGSPARVVVANPNGITCSGCGFVNTPRITLTTGVPQFLSAPGGSAAAFEQSSALALDVRSGQVRVEGAGLEGTSGRIDIVAETIVLDAPLRANLGPAGRIDLVAGRQRVAEAVDAEFVVSGNGATNTVQGIRVGDQPFSAYAIDGSAFGAMTAGQIKVIATPQGMGVRAEAALAASTGNLTISSNGDVRVGSAFSNRDLALDGAGDLGATGEVYAARDVALRAGGGLRAEGGISAGQHVDLQAVGDVVLGGSTLAQGSATVVSRLGSVAAAGGIGARTLDVDAGNGVDLRGGVAISAEASITAGANLALKQGVAVGGNLNLTAGGDITSDAETRVVGHLQAVSGRDGRFDGALSVAGNLRVDAAQNVWFGDTVEIAGDGDLHARAGNLTTNRTFAAGGSARLEASNALILGDTLQSARTLSLRSGGATSVRGGILAGGDTVVSGGTVAVGGTVTVIGNGDFSSHSGGMTFGADVQAAGNLTLRSAMDLGASGAVLALGAIDLSAGRASSLAGAVVSGNSALIRAGQHLSTATVSAVEHVMIESGGDLTMTGPVTAGRLTARAGAALNAGGQLEAAGSVELVARSGDLDAVGAIYAGADASLSAAGNVRLGGTVSAQGFADMTAGGGLTLSGPVAADRLTAGAGGMLDARARLASAGDMRLRGSDVRTSGLLVGGGLVVDARRDTLLAGENLVRGDVRVGAGARFAHDGQTSIGGSLAVSGVEISNSGSLYASGNVALGGGNVTNRGTVYGHDATVTAPLFDNAGGNLLAGNDLAVDVAALSSNANGLLAAERDASITAAGVLANGGTILAGRDLHLSAPDSAFDPATTGDIAAGNLLGISAHSFSNTGEWLPHALRLTVSARTDFSNFGNSGRIAAGGTLDLSGTSVTNSGTLSSDRNLNLAGNVVNRGTLSALRSLTVTGSGFDNRGARTQADGDLVVRVTGSLVNVGGDLITLGNAELQAGAINNDRVEPTDVTTVTRGHNPDILNGIVLLPESVVTEDVPCGESTCLNTSVVPRVTIGSLGPNYATNTVAVERESLPYSSTTLILPQTVREEHAQSHGGGSRILVAGDATLVAQGTVTNRGGLIESGGSLSITAQSLDSGRSPTLINGATEGTDEADLSRFVDELNAARGAGTVVWVCNGEANCTPEAVPSYATNPVTTSSIVHTPGLAGNILAGADLRVSLAGDFGNSGLAAAAGDLVLTGANLANQPAATLLAGQDLALTLSGGLTNEQGAQIVSGRDMRLSMAGAVTNSAATIDS
ncbi:MAG: filamentous hemagglutinin family outer membrane protein, partial [Proteobacteria bacterium]|nr:filamentous hemagglutinin family outer membrane protein [Pseudomonadota bacterium]